MVLAAISYRGKTHYLEPKGVKINQEVYIEYILERAPNSWYNATYDDEIWILQVGEMSHNICVTQQ